MTKNATDYSAMVLKAYLTRSTMRDSAQLRKATTPDTGQHQRYDNWWWGRNDDLEIRDATRNWDAIDKLYSEYDSLKIDYPYGQFVPEVDDIQSKIDNINEVYTNYTKQISYGKYQGTAEEIVAEMQSALKQAGIEEVTAALQEQFDALYK